MRIGSKKELSSEFVERTILDWQPFSSDPLTANDAREIIQNLNQFFDILFEWDNKQKQNVEKIQNKSD